MRYQFIREHREEFSVQRMCQLLGVTRSGYYAWQPEKLCPRELENQVLVEQIRVEYKTSRQTYGSPRIWVRLLGRGVVNVGAKCPQIIGLKSPLFNALCPVGYVKLPVGLHIIQLPPSVSEVLAETLQRRAEYVKSERWETDGGLVFTTSVGTPVEYRNVITHFKKVISETGLPNIRFHDLRHTVTPLLLSKEINPKIVQEQVGHSSINLTLNTYSHVIKSMRGIAANALDDVVGSD